MPAIVDIPALLPGTVGYWPFQGDRLDYSGNHYDLTVERGVEAYGVIQTGLQGFNFNGSTNLLGPIAPLLAVQGEMTIDWISFTTAGGVYTFFSNEGLISGNYSLYSCYNSAGGLGNYGISYTDQTHNQALGLPNPPGFVETLNTPNRWTLRRRYLSTSPVKYIVELFCNGLLVPGGVETVPQVADNTERLRVGGFSLAANYQGKLAYLRILGYARPVASNPALGGFGGEEF